jgi:hypothetical protein
VTVMNPALAAIVLSGSISVVACDEKNRQEGAQTSSVAPVAPSAKSACKQLRSCCSELSRNAQIEEAPCVAWTRPDPNNGGECGYGTDCWCGAMLEGLQTSYGACK